MRAHGLPESPWGAETRGRNPLEAHQLPSLSQVFGTAIPPDPCGCDGVTLKRSSYGRVRYLRGRVVRVGSFDGDEYLLTSVRAKLLSGEQPSV